jgi:hypothetical protein
MFDPETQQIGLRKEREIYGYHGGLATDTEIIKEYLAGFRRPYICALMNDVLSGRWELGKTMTQVADAIGTDHPTISRAARRGELPNALETYLLACSTIPEDWPGPINRVRSARHRAGFMGVAEYLWRKQPGIRWPMTQPLYEIHAEFLFTLWENRHYWEKARETRDMAMVHALVMSVLEDPQREIIPFWYEKARCKYVTALIEQLKSVDRFAFKWLCLLQTRWEDIFVTTEAAKEGLGWIQRMTRFHVRNEKT